MAKFTRTAYASGSLRDIVRELAAQANIDLDPNLFHDALHTRAAAGRRRVRITILVEPEKAPPKRPSGSRRPRPIQVPLELNP